MYKPKTILSISGIILILIIVACYFIYPIKHQLLKLNALSYSSPVVDQALTKKYKDQLLKSKITNITNQSSMGQSESKITFFFYDNLYTVKDDLLDTKSSEIKNAVINFDGNLVKFVGHIELSPSGDVNAYDYYDAGFLAGKIAIENAISHIEYLRIKAIRDDIHLNNQKENWIETGFN